MVIIILFFGFGLMVGSFVNAVVWRLYIRQTSNVERRTEEEERRASNVERRKLDRETSITRGRSMCPGCRHPLAARDLIPVVSWMLLRGKCRYCKKPISVQYPLVELITAGLFALSANTFINPGYSLPTILNLGFWLYFLTVLIILTVYDWRWYLLPDVVLLPAIIVAMTQLAVWGAMGVPIALITNHLASGLVAGAGFYAVAALSNGRWMGGGDIKLAFLMGLLLGSSKTVLAMFLAFNTAAVVGLILIALKLKSRRDHMPFGPFLAGGSVLAQIYGNELVAWYLRLAGVS